MTDQKKHSDDNLNESDEKGKGEVAKDSEINGLSSKEISELDVGRKHLKLNDKQKENLKKNISRLKLSTSRKLSDNEKQIEKNVDVDEKILFINKLLDYSVKKKVDNKTRERLFNLISKEVDSSSLSKEDVERIVEEKLKQVVHRNKKEKEQKFEVDLTKHQPMNMVDFIDKFRDSKGIKYLTHKFEIPGQKFNANVILEIAKKEFDDFVKEHKLTWNFYNNFKAFAFGEGKYKGKWYFNNKEYSINWKSQEVVKWMSENPGMHPIEKFEKQLIKPFQLSYKIENGILKDYIIERLTKSLGESYGNFKIEIIDCDKANFKTDVDSLLSGISGILNSVKQRENNSKKIKIKFERKGRNRFLKIIHLSSRSNKSFEEEESDILQGDLSDVKSFFYNVCDWTIISENPSNKINQINILYDVKNKNAKEYTTETIEGFTHILTLYS